MFQRVFGCSVVLSILLFCWVLSAETVPRSDVRDAWNEEYEELAGHIERLKNWDDLFREWRLHPHPFFNLKADQFSITVAEGEITRQRLRNEALGSNPTGGEKDYPIGSLQDR